jgi:F-type H+-transporting ATPase subunit alpha
VKGYLDRLAVADVQRFEAELLRLMRGKHKDVMDEIRAKKQITPETEAQLKTIVEEFVKSFA